MKKLILCIDNNKCLTLIAIALGVITGIFGSATGWFAVIASVITGAALPTFEVLRRAYNELWSHENGKKWLMLSGMAITLSVILGGVCSIMFNTAESLGIFACLAALLFTFATAWALEKIAWEKYNPKDDKIVLVVWMLFLGILGIMSIGCYMLICWLMGTNAADLLRNDFIIYGSCISGGLMAIFVIVWLVFAVSALWNKIVKWASR